MSPLEHSRVTVKIVCSRSISHALVRHRHCAFTQESTHYLTYQELTFCGEFNDDESINMLENLEQRYLGMTGKRAQDKRWLLPQALKTELVITTNFREWLHIFDCRVLHKTGKDSDEMTKTMLPIAQAFYLACPEVFENPAPRVSSE
jgi:thymidylate synthase (FAD)